LPGCVVITRFDFPSPAIVLPHKRRALRAKQSAAAGMRDGTTIKLHRWRMLPASRLASGQNGFQARHEMGAPNMTFGCAPSADGTTVELHRFADAATRWVPQMRCSLREMWSRTVVFSPIHPFPFMSWLPRVDFSSKSHQTKPITRENGQWVVW
jgi:hypothetical protein